MCLLALPQLIEPSLRTVTKHLARGFSVSFSFRMPLPRPSKRLAWQATRQQLLPSLCSLDFYLGAFGAPNFYPPPKKIAGGGGGGGTGAVRTAQVLWFA